MSATNDDLTVEFGRAAEDILARVSANATIRREIDTLGFSGDAWAAAAEAGWFEALLHESAGGLGLSLEQLAPIFTAAGRHLFVGPLAEHAVAGALAASAASEAAHERLVATLSGTRRLAFADPVAAADAQEQVVLTGDRLSGAHGSVRFAQGADELLVAASDDGGLALVLVARDRRGVTVTPRPSLDPITLTASVRFEDVEIRSEDIVASGVVADALFARISAGMRIAVACELSGIAERVLEMAVEYAKQREQFGRPIGSFQALQHILAEMAREAFALSRLCREAAAAGDGIDALEDASLVAKAHAAGAARSVTEGSLQVHGGIAFTIEHELHRFYKHVLALEGFYGDRHALHERLGRRLLREGSDPWPAWSTP